MCHSICTQTTWRGEDEEGQQVKENRCEADEWNSFCKRFKSPGQFKQHTSNPNCPPIPKMKWKCGCLHHTLSPCTSSSVITGLNTRALVLLSLFSLHALYLGHMAPTQTFTLPTFPEHLFLLRMHAVFQLALNETWPVLVQSTLVKGKRFVFTCTTYIIYIWWWALLVDSQLVSESLQVQYLGLRLNLMCWTASRVCPLQLQSVNQINFCLWGMFKLQLLHSEICTQGSLPQPFAQPWNSCCTAELSRLHQESEDSALVVNYTISLTITIPRLMR